MSPSSRTSKNNMILKWPFLLFDFLNYFFTKKHFNTKLPPNSMHNWKTFHSYILKFEKSDLKFILRQVESDWTLYQLSFQHFCGFSIYEWNWNWRELKAHVSSLERSFSFKKLNPSMNNLTPSIKTFDLCHVLIGSGSYIINRLHNLLCLRSWGKDLKFFFLRDRIKANGRGWAKIW